MQSVQNQAAGSAKLRSTADRDDNGVLTMRAGDDGSLQAYPGPSRLLPRVLSKQESASGNRALDSY